MRPALIAIVGFAGLICVFLFQLYIPLLVVLLNSLALCCILIGTLVPIKSRFGRLAVHAWENKTPASNQSSWPCVAGVKLDPDLHSSLEFHLESRLLPLMTAGLLSLSAIAFVLQTQTNLLSPDSREDSGQFVVLFVGAFLSVIPLGTGVSWFMERMLLLRAVVTIGRLDSRSGAYNFEDQNGAGYGGIRKQWPIHPDDNLCLVFYSPANPGFNKSSSGLTFHQPVIRWT